MGTLYWTSYAFFTRVGRAYSAFRRRMLVRMAVGTRTPKAFVSHPEPKSIGSYTRGQQMMVGNFQLGGQLIEAPDRPIWSITGSRLVLDDLHGCAWVDDLAATGHATGRRLLQAWIAEWIRLYGAGTGHGWRPDLTGQRLIHWISHGITIMQGQDKAATNVFLKSVARQARFLSRTWKQVPRGLPRLRALVGLLYASLALEGRSRDLKPTLRRLGRECRRSIGPEGTVPSRSPEELMEAFTLLVWAARVAEEAGQTPDAQHLAALSRIAPTLRSLRLGDGSLVRFHGGGRGNVGQLDQSLSDSSIRPQPTESARMGYARLAAGRTVVLMDGAPPATGLASAEVHASTLAVEMSSGRQPLIVNTGPGRYFGPDWHRAARATACQSTLVVENTSSATVWDEGYVADTLGAWISERPTKVKLDRANDVSGLWVLGSHNGYAADYGLHHDRRMFVSPNGRDVRGRGFGLYPRSVRQGRA